MIFTQDEKDLIMKLIYHRYITCGDDYTARRCENILRKLGCRYPGFK